MTLNLNDLDTAGLEALVAQARLVQKARKDLPKLAYIEHITDFVAHAMATEKPVLGSAEKPWAGVKVYGIPVEHDGHTFTVSVTITDTVAKAANDAAKALADAEALIAAKA